MLAKKPAFTAVAILTLGLGIGANTAIFSVVRGVLLRPLAYPEPERLLMIWMTNTKEAGARDPLSDADFRDLRDETRTCERLAAFTDSTFDLTGQGEPERVLGIATTAEFFTILGVSASQGRTFAFGDDVRGSERIVVIAHGLWQRRFGGTPDVVGKRVILNGIPRTIIGVMPADFRFPPQGVSRGEAEVWVLMQDVAPTRRGPYYLWGLARTRSGVELVAAQSELRAIGQRVVQAHPLTNAETTFAAQPLKEALVGDMRQVLLVLLGVVTLILLIAASNVANLLLARTVEREKEFAVRVALGAGRGHIVRQLLTESLCLSFAGGAFGLMLARWGVDALVALSPENMPRMNEVRIDTMVLGFTWLVTVLSGVLFGLFPALHPLISLNESLKEGGRSGGGGRRRQSTRQLLIVTEVALCFVLLVGAVLMLNSFSRLVRTSPGFTPQNILSAHLSLPGSRYPKNEQVNGFYSQLIERARAIPGVESAGIGISLPPHQLSITDNFTVAGVSAEAGRAAPSAPLLFVSAGYFEALGVPILRGRNFDERDSASAPPVVLINKTLEQRYFPNQDPIGKRMKIGGPERPDNRWMEVVGVVGDVKFNGLAAEPPPTYYLPYQQASWNSTYLVVSSRTSPQRLSGAIRAAVWSLDKDLPVRSVLSMEDLIASSVEEPRFRALLLTLFGALALALATVGMYGALSCDVAQRLHEMGVRMALGAQRRDILRLVLKEGMTWTLLGLAFGIACALALTRLISKLLYGVSVTDPIIYVTASAVLVLTALIACGIPAYRATLADPLVVLRYQ